VPLDYARSGPHGALHSSPTRRSSDLGMNASTFSARVTIATFSDIYSAVTSAIGTLKGPLHGGANEGVMRMLQEIGDPAVAADWVDRKSTRLNSSHVKISYAVFCLKKK